MVLEREDFRIRSGQRTDVGRVRAHNEDAALCDDVQGLWAVADGMGGHSAGNIASGIVVDSLATVGWTQLFEDLVERVVDRTHGANRAIRAHARTHGLGSIGATIAALTVCEGRYACIWAGDSRVYLLRDGKLHQLTHDHSVVQDMVDSGDLKQAETRTHSRRNEITNAVGISKEMDLSVRHSTVHADDRFVLCSDGLTEHVQDAEIAELCTDRAQMPTDLCDVLVDLANARGGKDNITVVICDVRRQGWDK